MKNNKPAIYTAAVVFLVLILTLASLSARSAYKEGYSFSWPSLSIGGQVELRNTMTTSLSEVDSLNIDYGSQNIKFFVQEGNEIVIKEYLVKERELGTMDISGGTATVTGGKNININFFNFSGEERIEVFIPKTGLKELAAATGSGNISAQTGFGGEYNALALATGSGNVKWYNTKADLAVAVGSGNISLDQIEGDVSAGAGSGNITIDDVTGTVDAKASSGNIHISGLDGDGNMKTGSGLIEVDMEQLTGDICLDTGSGNAKLFLPENASGHVELDTGSGNINTNFDDALSYNKNGEHATGNLGDDADNQIEISTGSGNIHVKR